NTWEVGGFGEIKFDWANYWRCDPLTGQDWGLEYHADIPIYTAGGPDIRVLWELNRFGHVLALARAFAITNDEKYADTFFRHVEEWTAQNPYARGANWTSPMDAIMRAVNVVAALELIKHAESCTPERLALILKLADTHCRFTVDNSEFSYIATGNHYITNVAGLFFVATLLPELKHAKEWQQFGLSELLREIERQVLPDGADWESATGYHKIVTEVFLVCLLLADKNDIPVADEHLARCRKMLEYLREVIRTDGGMPLIGDCDGSQFLPIVRRDADDATYLLDLAAALCDKAELKISDECSPEVLWLLGKDGVDKFNSLAAATQTSVSFPYAGSHVLRHEDLYILLNTNDVGLNGRGSHSHNDALSIEVSALGRPWIIDPGSYVYNLDREARHRFRSTAAHSTLMIDGREQNSIDVEEPFVSANDARPKLIEWSSSGRRLIAEHLGYAPIIHRRTAVLERNDRCFLITDEVRGEGHHDLVFSFHLAPGIDVEHIDNGVVLRCANGGSLIIASDLSAIEIADAGYARHYGKSEPTKIARFRVSTALPANVRWLIIPVAQAEDPDDRLAALRHLLQNNS
ncbi:MAG TPA: alginate lyase family protein, partial [Pyrinomonadaceae bacterium]|nr:alginate lyase family protein [Pyrinomonadaceae bacterium]